MDVSYSPARDPAGQIIGVLVLARDVSDIVATNDALERSNAELRRANEGLEQFARMTSHDLREPLNTIVQFTGLIEREHAAELSAASSGYFHLVLAGAQRMRRMLDDLLEFVRLDHADAPVQPVALGPGLSEVCANLDARIAQRSAHIDLQPLPEVMGTESLLSALFQNLVSNAIKFVPPERPQGAHLVDARRRRRRCVRAGGRRRQRHRHRGTRSGAAVPAVQAPERAAKVRGHRPRAGDLLPGRGALGGAITIESAADTVGSRFVVRLRRSVVSPG